MARLTIEQVRAPDLSVASQATARAGDSFREGMSSANELLGKYQEGLESAGDAQLTNLLAGAKTEEEWNSIVGSTDFGSMNLSDGMRMEIMNRRDNVLGYEQQRTDRNLTQADIGLRGAQTDNTYATAARTRNATGIDSNRDARAGEIHGITMGDHNWRQSARTEDARLGNLLVGANQEALQFGNNGVDSGLVDEDTSGLGGRFVSPEGGYTAPVGNMMNQAFQSEMNVDAATADILTQAFLMNFEHESGMIGDRVEDEPNVHGTRGKGYYQLTGVRRDDFEARFGADGYTDENQVMNLIDELGGSQSAAGRAILEAARTGNVGETAAVIVRDFLRPAAEHRDRRMAQYRSVSPGRTPVTENAQATGGRAAQQLNQALQNSRFQSSAAQLAMSNGQYNQRGVGQTAIDAQDTAASDEFTAQSILDLQRDSSILTPKDAQLAGRELQGSSAAETLRLQENINAATGEGGLLANLALGTTGSSDEFKSVVEQVQNEVSAIQDRQPILYALKQSEAFESDPVASLKEALAGTGAAELTDINIEGQITAIVRKTGVSRGEAAYAFVAVASDRAGFNPDGVFTPLGDGLRQEFAEDFARDNFGAENSQKARTELQSFRNVEQEVITLQTQVDTLSRRIQRAGGPEEAPKNLMDQLEAAQNKIVEKMEEFIPSGNMASTNISSGSTSAAAEALQRAEIPTARSILLGQ